MLLGRSAQATPVSGVRPPLGDASLEPLGAWAQAPAMTELTQQLNAFERRLRSLERELEQLQGAAAVGAAEPVSAGREWVYFATTATPRRPDPRRLWSNLVADEVREHGLNIRRRRGSRASSTCRRSSARARSRGPAAS